jgi:hypothetical protein
MSRKCPHVTEDTNTPKTYGYFGAIWKMFGAIRVFSGLFWGYLENVWGDKGFLRAILGLSGKCLGR